MKFLVTISLLLFLVKSIDTKFGIATFLWSVLPDALKGPFSGIRDEDEYNSAMLLVLDTLYWFDTRST